MADDNALPFELKPIRKIDVFRSVLGQLDTLVSQLQPGDRLGSERELAERLDVSRVSVREALRALESMGKVEIRRNTGSFVAQQPLGQPIVVVAPAEVDSTYVRQLSEAREAVECAVVRAVLTSPEPDLSAPRLALREAAKAAQTKGASTGSLDLRFENALAATCGNPVLQAMQRSLHEMWIDAWVRLGGAVSDAAQLHTEHEQILAAIEDRDMTRAVRLMAEHVNPDARPRRRAPRRTAAG